MTTPRYKKDSGTARAAGWNKRPQGDAVEGDTVELRDMSGGLFRLAVSAAQVAPIDVWPGQFEIHQARGWYSAPLPLRNGAQSNATKRRYGLGSTKLFDDFRLLHATYFSALKISAQAH